MHGSSQQAAELGCKQVTELGRQVEVTKDRGTKSRYRTVPGLSDQGSSRRDVKDWPLHCSTCRIQCLGREVAYLVKVLAVKPAGLNPQGTGTELITPPLTSICPVWQVPLSHLKINTFFFLKNRVSSLRSQESGGSWTPHSGVTIALFLLPTADISQ